MTTPTRIARAAVGAAAAGAAMTEHRDRARLERDLAAVLAAHRITAKDLLPLLQAVAVLAGRGLAYTGEQVGQDWPQLVADTLDRIDPKA